MFQNFTFKSIVNGKKVRCRVALLAEKSTETGIVGVDQHTVSQEKEQSE